MRAREGRRFVRQHSTDEEEVRNMGELGRLIQAHIDRQRYRVSKAAVADAVGVSRQTITNWMDGTVMPGSDNARRLAAAIEQPYSRVLDALLVDAGYLAKELAHEPATTNPAGSAPADLDEYNEEVARIMAMRGVDAETRSRMIADLAVEMLGRTGDSGADRSGPARPGSSARSS
jgi:transcriptional regulator with XRE-family HTH domain